MTLTVTSGTIDMNDGTVSAPSIAFQAETGTGWFNSSGIVTVTRNGVACVKMFGSPFGTRFVGSLQPKTDNNLSLGDSNTFFHILYCANGTLQTSHSDFKRDIQDLPLTMEVPRGISFTWKPEVDKDQSLQLGFLADDLPKEAFYLDSNGEINKRGVYDGAVIGILCAHVRNLQTRVQTLTDELKTLQGA